MGKHWGIAEMESFGDLTLKTWIRMKRPYIAVFKENGKKEYVAKLYDGAEYTGIHIRSTSLTKVMRDIERYTFGIAKTKPGPADPEDLFCVYM